MKKYTSNNLKPYLIGMILLVTMWQVLSFMIGKETMVFPGPIMTVRHFVVLLSREYTYRCIISTMFRMFMGFTISLILGLIFGVIAGNSAYIEKVFSPFFTTLRAIPTASLVYLFIVLAGFASAPMYLVVMISFPIIYEGVLGGIKSTPKELLEAARSDGASIVLENIRIRLPLALPYITVAMASAFSLCFKIEIMAEVITGSTLPGLGSAILGARSSDPTNMVPVFAYSLIAIILMLIIDYFAVAIKNTISTN